MITNEDIQKLADLKATMEPRVNLEGVVIGNSDILKILQLAQKLIEEHAKPETQNSDAIKRLVRELPNAKTFLEEHPGGPPQV